MNVPHRNLNTRVAEQRAEGREIGARGHGASRKRMTKIVEPEMALDLGALDSGSVRLLHATD
jgi:hypothetical protein